MWILIANGWMQHPVGSHFNPDTMRMEVTNFKTVLFNPVAQDKFVHTVSAGYVTGAIFVASISAFYLLRGRHIEMAKRSMAVAASFGLAAALSVVVLGDESGYTAGANQRMKIAAIEAMWHTEKAPASFTLFGIPNEVTHQTDFAVRIPWALGLIVTRSLNTPVPGIVPLVEQAKKRIVTGLDAYKALQKLRKNRDDPVAHDDLAANGETLGYALLLKGQRPDIENATPEQIEKAAWTTVPAVLPLFFSFRIMVGLGFFFIALFATTFYFVSARKIERTRPLLCHPLFSALALGGGRTRLVRLGGRAPALGDRRRAADIPRRIEHLGCQCRDDAHRLCRLLLGAAHHRRLSDGEDGPIWTERIARTSGHARRCSADSRRISLGNTDHADL